MTRLVRAEFAKLFATRVWLWLLLASMALTALFASLNLAYNNDPDTLAPPLNTAAGQQLQFATSASGPRILIAVLAAIGMAGEYRHRTATPTFLATPHRHRVVAAKLVTYPVAGIGYALACIAVVTALTWPWLTTKGIDPTLIGHGIPGTLAGVVATVALFAILGVGLGAWSRDQTASVVGLMVYLFVAEPIVTRIPALQDWTIYLPGPAASGLTQISLSDQDFLAPWQGGLALSLYAALAVIAGVRRTAQADIV